MDAPLSPIIFHSEHHMSEQNVLHSSQQLYVAQQLSEVLNQGRHVRNCSNPQSPLPAHFWAILILTTLFSSLSFPLYLRLSPLSPFSSPLTQLLSPPSLPQQNYRGLLVVKSVFLQPGISTGQHSVRTLHSLCLPNNSHAHVRARCLRSCSWNDPDWATMAFRRLKRLFLLFC